MKTTLDKINYLKANYKKIGFELSKEFVKSFEPDCNAWDDMTEAFDNKMSNDNFKIDWDELDQLDLEDEYIEVQTQIIEWARKAGSEQIKALEKGIKEAVLLLEKVNSKDFIPEVVEAHNLLKNLT